MSQESHGSAEKQPGIRQVLKEISRHDNVKCFFPQILAFLKILRTPFEWECHLLGIGYPKRGGGFQAPGGL